MYRQGDIFIEPVPALPQGARPRRNLVLAEGELTGHVHRVAESTGAALYESGENLFLHVTAPQAMIIHDEHGPITLTQGIYRVWRQRVYSPSPRTFLVQDVDVIHRAAAPRRRRNVRYARD